VSSVRDGRADCGRRRRRRRRAVSALHEAPDSHDDGALGLAVFSRVVDTERPERRRRDRSSYSAEVAGKRSKNQSYDVHGEGAASLVRGFDEVGMLEHRRAAALDIVREVVAVNAATDFYWYCTPSDSEICCYWDDADQNQMWINPTGVVLREDESLAKLPERPRDYFLGADRLAGWLLPGAEMGSGGGPQRREIPTVGSICPDCEVMHG
jgi:hypothetical protein